MKRFIVALFVGALCFITAPLAQAGKCGDSTIAWNTTELLVTRANAVLMSESQQMQFDALRDEAIGYHVTWRNVATINAAKADYNADMLRFSQVIANMAMLLREAGDHEVNVEPVLAALNTNLDWMTPFAADLAQVVQNHQPEASNWDIQTYQGGVTEALAQPNVLNPELNKQGHHILLGYTAIALYAGAAKNILANPEAFSPALVTAVERHIVVNPNPSEKQHYAANALYSICAFLLIVAGFVAVTQRRRDRSLSHHPLQQIPA